MGEIKSSIGKVVHNPTNNMYGKKFVVEDPEFEQIDRRSIAQEEPRVETASNEENILERVEEVKKARNALDPERKSKLEILLGLKRKYANITVDGHVLTLRNLSAKESKKLIATAFTMQKENRQVDQIYDIRNFTLAASLYAIDDIKLSDILGENDNLEMRTSLIEEMSESAISDLYEFYEKVIAIKQPQNEKEAKEVFEDLKK